MPIISYQTIDGVRVWGNHDERTIAQLQRCVAPECAVTGVLCADGHVGYSQPIGGVVAYRGYVSPSGIGFDIACGNEAVRTNLQVSDIRKDLPRIMDEVFAQVSFGVGRNNPNPVDHELFDDPAWQDLPQGVELRTLAWRQLGTVGSGNHYVDLFEESATGALWVGVHFGSRGLGHKIASGFLNLAAGRAFDDKAPGESMDQDPTLICADSELGNAYIQAMQLAGRYAYAGRDYVVQQVLDILGAQSTFTVHNHHNFAWVEKHDGELLNVVRKGATPNGPGQLGFIGGSMGDISVIVRGVESQENADALYSTVHGAGRVMSRTQAAGKWKKVINESGRKVRVRQGGAVNWTDVRTSLANRGIELRGGGADEAPQVYKRLHDVLAAHANTLEILHVLEPIGVAMAGADTFDPFKD